MKRVCVYCGSKTGDDPAFLDAARKFGSALARHGLDLVYGGAQHGLMGAVADGVIDGGRHVIGVIPHGLARQEFAHARVQEVLFVDSMYERKALMAQKADAFVALPGGFGTMDELFDMLTGAQVGLHRKPIGLLDTLGYYRPIVAWVQQGFARGFIPPVLEKVLLVREDPEELVAALLTHEAPESAIRWLTRSDQR